MINTRSGIRSRFGVSALLASALVLPGLCAVGVPPASADPSPILEQALMAARAGSSCGAFGADPQVAHAAEIINQSTKDYLTHSAETVPAESQHPDAIAKDVGVQATKTFALQGAAQTQAEAIKGLLVQGFSAIPDCGYSRIGTSTLYDANTGFTLVTAVLVGP